MTAPTQPPDPRVQRIADALTIWKYTVATDQADQKFARVLVEELGGREASVQGDGKPRTIWRQVMDALEVESNGDAVKKALALRAQQRENAETIAALKERVEMAEAANTELDNARKSAEQSARDLRENNATLRAELDAIKGAQREVRFAGAWTELTARYEGGRYAVSSGVATNWCDDVDAIVRHWPAAGNHRASLEALRHPAPALPVLKQMRELVQSMYDTFYTYYGVPIEVMDDAEGMLLQISNMVSGLQRKTPALPVVGACVVNDKGEVTHRWSDRWLARDMDVLEVIARKENGTLYKLLLGDKIGAPLPTEGGK